MFPLQDSIPSRTVPIVTLLLITVNCFVFALELACPEPFLEKLIYYFGIVPARFTSATWGHEFGVTTNSFWPFLTSMFLHGGWIHIISNMWTLWIFGDNVEDRMGHLRFFIFYLLCGIVAGIIHVLVNPHSAVPTIGASGAIAGVLGAYFLLFPTSRIIVFFPLFLFWPIFYVMPAFLYLGIWFFLQFFSGTLSLLSSASAAGGIAWWAHIGGFLSGIAVHRIFIKRPKIKRLTYLNEYGPREAWFRF